MKILVIAAFLSVPLFAQNPPNGVTMHTADPTGSCSYPSADWQNYSNQKLWNCGTDATWHQVIGAGGGGSVTSVATGSCLKGGPITTTGTIALDGAVNPQTTTYQVLAADFSACKTITVASGTFTITLVASGSQPAAGQSISILNYGSGTVTVARSGQNINGGTASLTIGPGSATSPSGASIKSDGTDYFALVGSSFPATTCTNQFIRSLAAGTAAGTCASVAAASDVTGTLPVANGGTGVTAVQGNGSKVQLSTGTTTTNDCVKFDANGNTVDAGSACGGAAAAVSWGSYGTSAVNLTTISGLFGPIFGTTAIGATESLVQSAVSSATSLTNLQVKATNVGASDTLTVTLRVNGASSALTCQIGSSGTSCSDTTHSVAVVAGDLVDVIFAATGISLPASAQLAYGISQTGAQGATGATGATGPANNPSPTAGTSISLTSGIAQFFICTGTCTVTPPVPAAGAQYCVYNDNNVATVITLAAIGSSARYENTARTAYGTAGTGTFISGGAVKDSVCIVFRDSTHYSTLSSNGSWTAN